MSQIHEPSSQSTRRQFGQSLALMATAPLTGDALAEQAAVDPAVALLAANVEYFRARYGKFLTPAQLEGVKRSLARNQVIADLLRQASLTNSDEPAFAFRADLP
jgi:hypothetical protein